MSHLPIIFLIVIAPLLALFLAFLGFVTIPTNPMGWFLLLTGAVYAAGSIVFAFIRRERFWEGQTPKNTVQEEHGDRSFWFITLAMMAAFYLSPLEYVYFTARLPRTFWMALAGVGIVVAGSALFVWARRTLGRNYSGHVSVGREQELVQRGPYRLIRHPAYMGYFLMALGISIGYSSLLGLASVLLLLLPTLIYRMNVEERLLTDSFGEQYHQYASRVKRFIPGLW